MNPNDPSDIAWGVINASEDPQRRVQLGLNGRKKVLQEFTWDVIAKKTSKVYMELIDSLKTKKS